MLNSFFLSAKSILTTTDSIEGKGEASKNQEVEHSRQKELQVQRPGDESRLSVFKAKKKASVAGALKEGEW